MSKETEIEKVKQGENLPSVAQEYTLADMLELAEAIKMGVEQEVVSLGVNLSSENWDVNKTPEIQRALLSSIGEMQLPNKRTGEIETHKAAFFIDLKTMQSYYKISVRFVQAMQTLMGMKSAGKYKQFYVKFTGTAPTKSGGNMQMFQIIPFIILPTINVEDSAE